MGLTTTARCSCWRFWKEGGLIVSSCDAYMNVIGGLYLDEPAADLAAIISIASSFRDKPVPGELTAIGEVGLTGELCSVSALGQRLLKLGVWALNGV